MPRDAPEISHQIAQASPASAGPGGAAPIGRVDTVDGTVTAQHVDGTVETLAQGASVYQRDLITTKAGAKVALVFADKTTFALGESGQMRLDEMVYDPTHKSGKLALSMLKGAFAFVSGDIAGTESDAMTVRTPVGTIGIRGTAVTGNVDPDGASTFSAVPDPSGRQSTVSFTNGAGTQIVTENFTITVQTFFTAPSLPYASPGGALSEIGALAAIAGAISKVVNPSGGSTPSGPAAPAPTPQGAEGAENNTPVVHVTLAETDFSSAGITFGFTLTLIYTFTQPLDQFVQVPVQLQISPPPPPTVNGPIGLIGTLGVDHFVGGPGADFFNFSFIHNSLQSGDFVDGRGGADVLTATFDRSFVIGPSLTITNVPTINLQIHGASSLDALGITTGSLAPGPATITVTGTGALTVTDLQVNFDGSAMIDPLSVTAIAGGLTIMGGQAANLLAGAGFGMGDVLSYAKAVAPIAVNFAAGAAMHGGFTDTISGFDGVVGSAFNDTINVSLAGGGHHFTVEGGAGNNTMTGSFSDSDTLSYAHATSGAAVDFSAGVASSNGYGGSDVFSGFVAVIGSAFNDTFITTDTSVSIVGGGGNDTVSVDGTINNLTLVGVQDVIGINPGATSTNLLVVAPTNGFVVDLSGSGGNDAVSVIGGTNGLVSIAGASDTILVVGAGDTISSANTSADDNIVALGNGMVITAGNGADSVTAVGSSDLIIVGNGDDMIGVLGNNDTVNYGSGRDTINVVGSDDVLTDVVPIRDVITIAGNNDILNLSGGSNAITVTGTNDQISSTAGDDAISVGGGSVTINFLTAGNDPISFIGNGASATINFVNGATDVFSMTGGDNFAMINGTSGSTVTINDSGAGNAITLGSDDFITVNMSGTNSSLAVNVSNDTNSLVLNGTGVGSNELIVITGSGDSSLIAASLDDTIGVGGGNDQLFIGVTSTSGPHTDMVTLSGVDDTLFVGSDDSVTASLSGSSDIINIFGDDVLVTMAASGSSATINLVAGNLDLLEVQGSNNAITFAINPTAGDDSVLATGSQNVIAVTGSGSTTITVDATGANDTFSFIGSYDTILAGGGGGENFAINVSGADDVIRIVGNNDVIAFGGNGTGALDYSNVSTPAVLDITTFFDPPPCSSFQTFVSGFSPSGGTAGDTFTNVPNLSAPAGSELVFTAGVDGSGLTSINLNTGQLGTSDGNCATAISGFTAVDYQGNANISIFGGAAGGNFISAGGGTDSIFDNGGSGDTIIAGNGNDFLSLSGNNHSITLGSGDDNLTDSVGAGGNTVVAGNGNDFIYVGGSANSITLGSGADTVTGGGSKETLSLGSGDDVISFGGGGVVSLTNGNDSITVAGSNDTISAGTGDDVISLGADDAITVGNGHFTVNLSGLDTVSFGGGQYLANLNGGDDVISVATGNITISDVTNGGGDVVTVGNGTAFLDVGGPNDAITVGNGDDLVTGGSGNESIVAGNGNDSLSVSGNNNNIVAGSGNDLISSNADDTISLGSGADTINVTGFGHDLITVGGGGSLTIQGTAFDSITSAGVNETINLGTSDDNLTLTGAGNTVNLGSANVTVTGFEGGNTLNVGSGTDTLVLSSQAYSFSNAASGPDANTDVINGFQDTGAHTSVIDLSNLSGAGTETLVGGSLGTFAAGTPLSTAFAAAAANQVEYAVIGGNTFVHANSSVAAGYSAGDLLVELTGAHTLTGANFHLHL